MEQVNAKNICVSERNYTQNNGEKANTSVDILEENPLPLVISALEWVDVTLLYQYGIELQPGKNERASMNKSAPKLFTDNN